MPCFILLAAAAASAQPVPTAPTLSDERTVIEAQLNAPLRNGPAGGLTSREAAVLELQYIQSIGKRIERDKGSFSQGGQAR